MTTIISELKEKRDALLASLDDTANRLQALPADAPKEERDVLDSIFRRDQEAIDRLNDDIARRTVIQQQRAAMQPQTDDEPTTTDANGRVQVRVGKEPLTYERGGPNRFYRDVIEAKQGDLSAQQRLQRHAAEMRVEMRDISNTATAGGEFVPPMYLQERWIPLLRAGRPTADAVTQLPLEQGTTSITLPRLATGTATAIQTADNAAVQETDPTTNSVTATLKTIAGQVDLSRQLYEFSQPGIDEILFRDLARDYATKLDIQVLSGSGSAGQALGVRNVAGITTTAAGTTATAAALWPKIASGIASITTAYLQPDTIVMHPRRIAFWRAALDSSNRPLFDAGSPFNSLGNLDNAQANGFAGYLQGYRVIVDPNIPTNVGAGTNEDVIIVMAASEMFLWEEGAPRTKVFEDIGSGTLTVRLQAYGFFMFMPNRYPAAISVITGTALVPPTF